MVKKVRVPKWKPKRLWTPRQLAELSAEIEKLKQNVQDSSTKIGPLGERLAALRQSPLILSS